jgi:hypothetical protein
VAFRQAKTAAEHLVKTGSQTKEAVGLLWTLAVVKQRLLPSLKALKAISAVC